MLGARQSCSGGMPLPVAPSPLSFSGTHLLTHSCLSSSLALLCPGDRTWAVSRCFSYFVAPCPCLFLTSSQTHLGYLWPLAVVEDKTLNPSVPQFPHPEIKGFLCFVFWLKEKAREGEAVFPSFPPLCRCSCPATWLLLSSAPLPTFPPASHRLLRPGLALPGRFPAGRVWPRGL